MPGEYHLQARIAAEHAATGAHRLAADRRLYAELERLDPSPVVRLNRAVAVAVAGSPEAGTGSCSTGSTRVLRVSHLLPAVRGELLTRWDRRDEAATAFDAALALVRTEPEREHLRRRRTQL